MGKNYETVSCGSDTLRREIGEGTFVGFKRISTVEERVEWLKHLYAYRYVEIFDEGKVVLDLGCGTGYGTYELSKKAILTVGTDIWREGIHFCNQTYGEAASFIVAPGFKLPFKENSFDLVVSFQVIEHIVPKMASCFLEEIKRVLRSDGIFVVSTPNKRLRLLPFQKPWNLDHKKEYGAKDLKNVLERVFEKVEILGLFASKDQYLAEYYRVKQNPLFVYLADPITSRVKRNFSPILANAFKGFMAGRTKNKRSAKRTDIEHDFWLKDLKTLQRNIDSCIDLYGICAKKMDVDYSDFETGV